MIESGKNSRCFTLDNKFIRPGTSCGIDDGDEMYMKPVCLNRFQGLTLAKIVHINISDIPSIHLNLYQAAIPNDSCFVYPKYSTQQLK